MEQSVVKINLSMELLFNELSINPVCEDKYKANERMETFIKAVAVARKQGMKNIRSELPSNSIHLAENYSMHDWMFNKNDVPEVYRNLLLGMIVLPFIKDENEEMVDKYIKSDFYFEDIDSGIAKTKCIGLASAFLYETPSISLTSLPVWEKTVLQILVETVNNTENGEIVTSTIENVFNIAKDTSFGSREISDFIQSISELNLRITDIAPEQKKIHLADHHGKAELHELCERLKHNEYVVEMRSMEWCRGKCDKFIKKTHNNGILEIVLHKTDKKYGLWVQTTGQNMRETIAIAKIIEERYS